MSCIRHNAAAARPRPHSRRNDIILGMLELVDAVRARHVNPVISIYCIVAAEPYFASFRSA
jgi:hypothetical protein